MMRSKRLSYIPTFEHVNDCMSDDLNVEGNYQAMEIDINDCNDKFMIRNEIESEIEDGEIEMVSELDVNEQEYYQNNDDGGKFEEHCEENDKVFPLISEPLKTFVTVNPATLEDEELWPLSSLKSLCEYVGLSVKGNRRCILNRLQTWNGAPLSGAGHPDSYDTRSARFHTVPMVFLEKSKVNETIKVVNLQGKREKKDRDSICISNNSMNDIGDGRELDENESNNINLKSFHSPCILKKMETLTSTPVTSSRREIKSCLNTTSTPRKRSTQTSKSAGRICFSPYNHVRVFVSNPGERELNMDPNSILRLIEDDDYEFDDDDNDRFLDENDLQSNFENKDTCLIVNKDLTDQENNDKSNFWNNSTSVFMSNE